MCLSRDEIEGNKDVIWTCVQEILKFLVLCRVTSGKIHHFNQFSSSSPEEDDFGIARPIRTWSRDWGIPWLRVDPSSVSSSVYYSGIQARTDGQPLGSQHKHRTIDQSPASRACPSVIGSLFTPSNRKENEDNKELIRWPLLLKEVYLHLLASLERVVN